MRSARCGPPEYALAVLLGTSSRTSSPNTRSTIGSARSRSVASSASAACNLAAASPEDSPCVCPSGPPISAWLDPGPWPRPTTTSSITPTTDSRGQRKRRRESPGSASCSATHPSDYVRALLEPVPALQHANALQVRAPLSSPSPLSPPRSPPRSPLSALRSPRSSPLSALRSPRSRAVWKAT